MILRWIQAVLLTISIVTLGYSGFVFADRWYFQHRESQALEETLNLPPTATEPLPTRPDGLVGRIEVPRLGVSVVVMEGTDDKTLRRAAGHVAGTGFPGAPGNIGISAHRDTFFRPLKDIREDDIITLTTPDGQYRYRVRSTKIVEPTDVSVLEGDSTEVLTLVTCYPFYFVGSAPNRFIVRAERVS